jgi:hypothetical protein
MKHLKELLQCLAVLAVLMGLIMIGYWIGQKTPVRVTVTRMDDRLTDEPTLSTSPNKGAGIPSSLRNEPAPTFEDLLDAIEWVESKGDPNAIGDNGKAVGAYQIHKIYVDDVNRIGELSAISRKGASWFHEQGLYHMFKYEHRFSKQLSRIMTEIYTTYYAFGFTGTPTEYLETCARIHKGGPKGHLKESTLPYWEKVKARMESRKE